MLIAGDIGGTKTRLALVSLEAAPRTFAAEQEFDNAQFTGVEQIIKAFVDTNGASATSACFDVAGPVFDGRAHMTNLGWTLDEATLRESLGLKRVTLVNDLSACVSAWKIDPLKGWIGVQN